MWIAEDAMMRIAIAGLALTVACGAMMAQTEAPWREKQPAPGKDAKHVVVVELFTGEGCSSCPPADALLAKLDAEYRAAGKPVLFLAEHVDYWDSLGWKDPFATAEFSARQRAYARSIKNDGSSGVYTPQMVVDGRVGFVGSDEARARGAIDKALAIAPGVRVQATIGTRAKGDAIRCEVKPDGIPKGSHVLVALVQNGLTSDVKRGENSGRMLKHERVVRVLARADLKKDALVAEIKPPKDLKEQDTHIVVFVQDDSTKAILGATELSLTPPTKDEPARK
jgi:hypothetical protein